MINNIIAYKGTTYIRDLMVVYGIAVDDRAMGLRYLTLYGIDFVFTEYYGLREGCMCGQVCDS